jgi:hypothetical protein
MDTVMGLIMGPVNPFSNPEAAQESLNLLEIIAICATQRPGTYIWPGSLTTQTSAPLVPQQIPRVGALNPSSASHPAPGSLKVSYGTLPYPERPCSSHHAAALEAGRPQPAHSPTRSR